MSLGKDRVIGLLTERGRAVFFTAGVAYDFGGPNCEYTFEKISIWNEPFQSSWMGDPRAISCFQILSFKRLGPDSARIEFFDEGVESVYISGADAELLSHYQKMVLEESDHAALEMTKP